MNVFITVSNSIISFASLSLTNRSVQNVHPPCGPPCGPPFGTHVDPLFVPPPPLSSTCLLKNNSLANGWDTSCENMSNLPLRGLKLEEAYLQTHTNKKIDDFICWYISRWPEKLLVELCETWTLDFRVKLAGVQGGHG